MKVIIIIAGILLTLLVIAVLILHHPCFGRSMSSERRQSVEQSAHYHDGMFHNELATPQFTGNKSSAKALWEFLTAADSDRVPHESLPVVRTDLRSLPLDRDWIVWFGHSSYLFCLNGKRYLVDPLLKMEFPVTVMMRPFKGTDIYTPDDIPDIDVLIITHEHWDHLDYATLRDLRAKVKHAICPLGVAEYLEYWGYDKDIISETDWYEQLTVNDDTDTITCLPTRHFSNRLFGRNRTLWASFLVSSGSRKVYIGGDGGYDHRFRRIREQYGQVDLAMMENGQYNKDWALIHLTPEDLEKAIVDLQAKKVFTVHHDKFALAKHKWSEPDSVARQIAERHKITLLDSKIGEVVYY